MNKANQSGKCVVVQLPEASALNGVALSAISAPIPTVAEAVQIIGGASRLAGLRSETAQLATANIGIKLQLAIHIARKYSPLDSKEDLGLSVRQMFESPFWIEQIIYELNKHEGPWAIAVSGGALTWLPVTSDDVAAISTGEDLIEMLFHHLR